ncbi:MAG: DUF2290 domain-containing protein [Cobetia sp.]|jgi:hypothetical protein|uniref:DUF2290 domain-containing protein n=1 Tax=Cobetia sp. TaxID=1873876 RepID=UPI0032429B39
MSKIFDQSVLKSIRTLHSINFLTQAGAANSLNVSDSFKKLSFRSKSYMQVYDAGIRGQEFNVLLKDDSFFQFTEQVNGDIRLAFYPNPYRFIEYMGYKEEVLDLLDEDSITLDEYSQFLSEGSFTCDVPVIRFDYSIDQYDSFDHPAAHLHIGFYAENRWPVRKILTPHAFMLKVLRNYYVYLWSGENKLENCVELDTLYQHEAMECTSLGDDVFSDEEANRFYFC